MMIEGPEPGYKILAASGVVGDSGKPQAVYGYAFKSGGTAGVVTFFNGSTGAAPSTAVFDDSGIISLSKVVGLGAGIVFPSGVYASFDGNVTTLTVFCRQVRT